MSKKQQESDSSAPSGMPSTAVEAAPLPVKSKPYNDILAGKADQPDRLSIEVPLGPQPGVLQRHVNVQLDLPLAAALGRVHAALDAKHVRLASTGRVVQSRADAVRWLLEQVLAGIKQKQTNR